MLGVLWPVGAYKEDHVVHVVFGKEGLDCIIVDFLVHIAGDNDLISHSDPRGESLVKIFHKCSTSFPVVIDILHVPVLLTCH